MNEAFGARMRNGAGDGDFPGPRRRQAVLDDAAAPQMRRARRRRSRSGPVSTARTSTMGADLLRRRYTSGSRAAMTETPRAVPHRLNVTAPARASRSRYSATAVELERLELGADRVANLADRARTVDEVHDLVGDVVAVRQRGDRRSAPRRPGLLHHPVAVGRERTLHRRVAHRHPRVGRRRAAHAAPARQRHDPAVAFAVVGRGRRSMRSTSPSPESAIRHRGRRNARAIAAAAARAAALARRCYAASPPVAGRGHRDGAAPVFRQPLVRIRITQASSDCAVIRHRRQVVAARRRDERRALDLGRLDVVGDIAGGVDVDVRMIAQVDRRDREAAFLIDPVIAAALVRRDVGPERVLRSARAIGSRASCRRRRPRASRRRSHSVRTSPRRRR